MLPLLLSTLVYAGSPPLDQLCRERDAPRAHELGGEHPLLQGRGRSVETLPSYPYLSLWGEEELPTLPEDVLVLMDIGGDARLPAAQATRRLQQAYEAGARRFHLVRQRSPDPLRPPQQLPPPSTPPSTALLEAHARRIPHDELRSEALLHARRIYEAETSADCEAAVRRAASFRIALHEASPRRAERQGHPMVRELLAYAAARTTDFVLVDTITLTPDAEAYFVSGVFDETDVHALVQTAGGVWPTTLGEDSDVRFLAMAFLTFTSLEAPPHPGRELGDARCDVHVLFDRAGDAIAASTDCPEPHSSIAVDACMSARIQSIGKPVRTTIPVVFRYRE